MSYEIRLSDAACINLKALEPAVAETIMGRLEKIKDDPLEHSKRLDGVNLHSVKVGDYRLILRIDPNTTRLFVIKISNTLEKYAKLDTI